VKEVRGLKRRIAMVGLLVGAPIIAGGVLLLSTLSYRFTTNSTAVVQVQDDLLPDGTEAGDTTWARDVWSHGRKIEPATRRAVAQVYARAWVEMTQGVAATAVGVDPTFVGPALDSLTAMRPPAGRIGAKSHELQLRFYADDGAIVGLRAQTVTVIDVPVTGGLLRETSRDAYDVVLTLSDDATWRVRQWDRVAVSPATMRVEVLPPAKTFPFLKLLVAATAVLVLLAVAVEWYRRRRLRRRRALRLVADASPETDAPPETEDPVVSSPDPGGL
jgi:hypothetical protein